MLSLNEDEKNWLEQYQSAIESSHPNKVVRMAVFGSKARGDAGEKSDLDILLLVNDDSVDLRFSLQEIGYRLTQSLPIFPSIFVYPQVEWEALKEDGFPFQEAVEREAVAV